MGQVGGGDGLRGGGLMLWGYARVSTVDQNPAAQLDALRGAGVDEEHLVVDHASGAKASRPGLDRLVADLSRGDVLLVWKLDRLGRSLAHLVGLIGQLGDMGVQFRCVTQSSIDTTTPQGRMVFAITAAMAEFERDLIRERTAAGLAAARASGKRVGRPTSVSAGQAELVWRLAGEDMSQARIAMSTGLSRATVGRLLRGEIASAHLPEHPSLISQPS